MDARLTIVTLGVSDLPLSTKFYQEKFGWSLAAASDDNISFFQLNGILLSLFSRDKLAEDAALDSKGSGFRGVSIAYNTRSEAEVDELFAELGAKGVEIIKAPHKVFWGGYSGYIADPDDHLWEIAYNPFLTMDPAGNTHEDPS